MRLYKCRKSKFSPYLLTELTQIEHVMEANYTHQLRSHDGPGPIWTIFSARLLQATEIWMLLLYRSLFHGSLSHSYTNNLNVDADILEPSITFIRIDPKDDVDFNWIRLVSYLKPQWNIFSKMLPLQRRWAHNCCQLISWQKEAVTLVVCQISLDWIRDVYKENIRRHHQRFVIRVQHPVTLIWRNREYQ